MKIATYDEVDAEQVARLNHVCFGSYMDNPHAVRNVRRVDRRCSDYFGLYAVEGNEVLSQVVVFCVDAEPLKAWKRLLPSGEWVLYRKRQGVGTLRLS